MAVPPTFWAYGSAILLLSGIVCADIDADLDMYSVQLPTLD
jgi:hypothetical protein